SALIPNGVDPEVFSPGKRDRVAYGLPAGGPVALMVSALIESKRVIEGVRAAAKIPGLFLVIAGDGECRRQVDEEAQKLLPGRFLRVSLPRARMPGLYRCADVFLHMSRDEASANAYLEALATGLPVVTHDWEVTRWTLEDCGYLVDCADEQAVVAAVSRAIEDKSAENVSRRRELVQRKFAWSGIAERYSSFLQQVCDASYVSSPASAPAEKLEDVGVVVIGRNEGQRLVRCLESVGDKAAALIYVDSASKDDSVANAKRLGAEVVELDASAPFNAARARNEGVERLKEIAPDVEYVQFMDGDCELRPSWLARARREFDADMAIAAVCGRRRERFPNRSIYNRLMDLEWNTPIGPAKSVGGDAMFRLDPFSSARGFDRTVMAGEEPQLCLRLRHAEWTVMRVDAEMTLHDAAITHFAQWWRRQVRGGYGAMDVYSRFRMDGERLFARQTQSTVIWAVWWPAAVILAGIFGLIIGGVEEGGLATIILLLALPLQIARLSAKAFIRGIPPRTALAYGTLTMISKLAWFQGQMQCRRDRMRGRKSRLIEYKQPATQPVKASQ
ncbi:MAG TPA: glycosyltransferase, partial [Tepidisphaeraceae bacterium]